MIAHDPDRYVFVVVISTTIVFIIINASLQSPEGGHSRRYRGECVAQ